MAKKNKLKKIYQWHIKGTRCLNSTGQLVIRHFISVVFSSFQCGSHAFCFEKLKRKYFSELLNTIWSKLYKLFLNSFESTSSSLPSLFWLPLWLVYKVTFQKPLYLRLSINNNSFIRLIKHIFYLICYI